jgi:hypothetical protein
MKRLHKYFFSFLVVMHLFLLKSEAQRFGGNPPSTQWQQINLDSFQVIFPKGLEKYAMEVATVMRLMAQQTPQSIGNTIRKVPVVLQNQPVQSNGYVGLAPFRSEFFMNPPPLNFNLGSLPWHLQLALHEYRHVQQYANFNHGITKLGSFLLGEEGQALMNAAAVPDWFFEGDAVWQETQFSEQGRGRMPFFLNETKLLVGSKIPHSYQQLRNGSLRHLYPDHYQTGFILVAYGREKFGEEFWKKVTQDAVRFKGLFYPFQKAVQKHSGVSFKLFVQHAMDWYASIQVFDSTQTSVSLNPAITYQTNKRATRKKRSNFVDQYEFPQILEDSSVVYTRRSGQHIPRFERMGSNQRLLSRPISYDNYFSARGNQLVYTRLSVHPRYGWREYSDVVMFDLQLKKEKRITRRMRLFTPDLSEDQQVIVAVENQTSGASALVWLSNCGELLHKVEAASIEGGLVFFTPKFESGKSVVAGIRMRDGKSGLVRIHPEPFSMEEILPSTFQTVGVPSISSEFIYTNLSLEGIDRVVRIRRSTKEWSFANLPLGSYYPFQASQKLYASRFTINGMKPQAFALDSIIWQQPGSMSLPPDKLERPDPVVPLQELRSGMSLGNLTIDSFTISKYKQSTGLFHIHSWRPFFSEPDWSFTTYGQNILNTMLYELGYRFNTNESSHTLSANFLYGAWFPWLRLGSDYTFSRSAFDSRNNRNVQWNEWTFSGGLQIPLNLTGGRFFRNLSLLGTLNQTKVNYTGASRGNYRDETITYSRFGVNYSMFIQQAVKQIYPHFGWTVQTDYRDALGGDASKQWLLSTYLYLPGLHRTHSFVVGAAWQRRDSSGTYSFGNSFPGPRGYSAINHINMNRIALNYHFPLCYPDWGIGNIVYFKRIRPNVFYDFSSIENRFIVNNNTGATRFLRFDQRSTGVELFFDTQWWNQLPVSFGVRYSRLLDRDFFGRNANQFEFIMPINLF